MSVAKWNTPSAQGSNLASTILDSLGNGSTSGFINYDNATNLDLYANVELALGSITPTSGGTVTLRVHSAAGSGPTEPDNTGSVGGGDSYTLPLLISTSAKKVIFPMVRLYPFPLRFQITNNAGVAFAASANTFKVQPYNEQVV